MAGTRDPGSFRDPSAYVLMAGQDRVFRVLNDTAFEHYTFARNSGAYDNLVRKGWLLPAEPAEPMAGIDGHVLAQPRLPFISYPYEWPFELLKKAALLHLDLQISALEQGVTLSDASAYNVQFKGVQPIFIDVSSLQRYEEGSYWIGQRQFTEQFLLPLLLTSYFGVPFNSWYRGNLDGIPLTDFTSLLRWPQKLSLNNLMFVVMPARLKDGGSNRIGNTTKGRKLPKQALHHLLARLRSWIARLSPRSRSSTVWENYETDNSYLAHEEVAKKEFVAETTQRMKPTTVWDVGCNTGLYAEVALQSGAKRVIGFDSDHSALSRAVERAEKKNLELLPLYLDAVNPSPNQGWAQTERSGFTGRSSADMVLALAVSHHVIVGRNVPLPMFVDWLVSMAASGIVEFVPKNDPMIQRMLRFRPDIFDAYSAQDFEAALTSHASIVASRTISSSGRTLYAYTRR